ncbi:hypothetical protein QBC40DRAFT_191657 [Triangularia verruculosa]|uniref:Uncharacterized protein n=1 Tax=Triangularia verruculosa TaxID=2587418 RepID=A0AAN6XQB6_9PEZI|nr:hypothetical protein QBC40DRAFT_191657 [Triangularia verruculosa]
MCTFTLCHYSCRACGAAIDSQEVDLKACNKQRKNWDECRGPKKRGDSYHYLKPADCFYCGDSTFVEEDLDDEAVLDIDLRHQPTDNLPAPESYVAKVTVHFTNDPDFDPWKEYTTDKPVANVPMDINREQATVNPEGNSKTRPRCADQSDSGDDYDPWGDYAFSVATVKSKSEN